MKALAALAVAVALNTASLVAQQEEPKVTGGSTEASIEIILCCDPTDATQSNPAAPPLGGTYISNRTGTAEKMFDTVKVVRTNLNIGGRSRVIELRHRSSDGGERYSYLQYGADGRVSKAHFTGDRLSHGDNAEWIPLTIDRSQDLFSARLDR